MLPISLQHAALSNNGYNFQKEMAVSKPKITSSFFSILLSVAFLSLYVNVTVDLLASNSTNIPIFFFLNKMSSGGSP